LTVKVAELVPAATVTVAGTLALVGLLLESETKVPPSGAAPLRLTVPVELEPPPTVVGFSEREVNTGGFTASAVVCVMPL